MRAARARRAIGLSLLVPGLLIIPPSGASAQKRVTARHQGTDVTSHAERCVHVVRRGDSLRRLAARYRVARRSVITANHLTNPETLRVGQRLEIPGCRPASPRRATEPVLASAPDNGTPLLARVGPRRVPTWLYLAVPDFNRETVAFQWPIEGPIASGFGRRAGGWHAGVDIPAEAGTPIRAAAGGTVVFSGWERYYGRMVRIQHAGGFSSLYAHNLENVVEVGDEVTTSTVIGTVGRSGHASAHHLHFEIRHEGMAYNPLHLLEARETPVLAAVATLDGDEDRE